MDYNIIYIHETTSTNSYAQGMIANNTAKEGDVIITSFQTSGKGHGSNIWESERGKNIILSLIIEPSFIEASNQFVITQFVSLAICDAMSLILDEKEISIKWPNDIYFGNNKIAGILIQNYITGGKITSSIIGLGINVNQTKFYSEAPNPTSISLITIKSHDLIEFRDVLLENINKWYKKVCNVNQHKFLKEIYMSKLYRKGQVTRFIDKTGEFEGIIVDTDSFGRLKIKKTNSEIKIEIILYKDINMVI